MAGVARILLDFADEDIYRSYKCHRRKMCCIVKSSLFFLFAITIFVISCLMTREGANKGVFFGAIIINGIFSYRTKSMPSSAFMWISFASIRFVKCAE